MSNINKRASNYNAEQKNILIEYVRKNSKLTEGKFCKTFSYKDAQKMWQELAEMLNSIPSGGKKTWKQWRKVWQDIRNNTKCKRAQLNKSMRGTGGRPPLDMSLTDMDNSIIEIIGSEVIEGISGATESLVSINVNDIGVTDSDHRPIVPEFSENATCENTNKVTDESVIEETKTANEKPKYVSNKKKSSKVQRLNNSILASNNFLEISKQKLSIKEKYYERKLALLERDVKVKEEIATSLKELIDVFKNK